MPVAEETSSKKQLKSSTTENIRTTESKDVPKNKKNKTSDKPPKEMCENQKVKQQREKEKHVGLIINSLNVLCCQYYNFRLVIFFFMLIRIWICK